MLSLGQIQGKLTFVRVSGELELSELELAGSTVYINIHLEELASRLTSSS